MPVEREAKKKERQPEKGMDMAESTSRVADDCPPNLQQQHPRDRHRVCREWTRLIVEIVTMLAVVYYAKQATIQAKASKDAADAAKVAADATSASVRPWIVPNRWENIQVKKSPVSLPLIISNAGKTPALEVEWTWEVVIRDAIESPPVFTDCPLEHRRPLGPMPSDQPWRIPIEQDLSPESIAAVADGTRRLYLHACVPYGEVLSTERRVMEICAVYNPKSSYPEGYGGACYRIR
jgi:hypothetical protein